MPTRACSLFVLTLLLTGCGTGSRKPSPATESEELSPTFTFESGPVRPIALSPDGRRLFVVNTPNASLDIFQVTAAGLSPESSVHVGLEPVAVAARGPGEIWVVNQISDSVSVIDVSKSPPRVTRTLLVGDEPSDVVFAGPNGDRAFITTAHRGQHRTDPSLAAVPGAGDPALTTAGVGRADVWVFDAEHLGASVGGDPLAIVTLFGDTPRALAVSQDGATVYVAIFHSGNQSTVTNEQLPCPGFDGVDSSQPCTVNGVAIPGAPPGPATNYAGIPAPAVGVLLKADPAGAFRDVLGRDWSAATNFSLPDQDVFALDATSLATTATYRHVGTTLFGMAVNPRTGVVYVSNTEARNDLRFEGPGTYAGTTLQGHLAEARISVLDGTGTQTRHLNKHIDYRALPAPLGTADHSLSMPLGVAVNSDGSTLYVAAFGSSKVGVFATDALEDDTFDPTRSSAQYLSVTGGGPGGIALDESRGRLYVSTRFDDGVSVIDLASGRETSHLLLRNPEPARVRTGRSFLYDATKTSSNGEASCASCHLFADKDQLAWDLGNPDADRVESPLHVKLAEFAPPTINGGAEPRDLHPMKGPMSTQTLRGLSNHGAMHWRGDRAVGFYGNEPNATPPYDSELSFKNFVVAFNALLGLAPELAGSDMQAFSDFALAVVMPPNPVRSLDNSLNPAQAAGRAFFMGCTGLDSLTGRAASCDASGLPRGAGHFADGGPALDSGFTCQGCHRIDPAAGFFGTDGQASFESFPQILKIPQLRNLYDKVGMFGVPAHPGTNAGDNGPTGAQVRGFGFLHDGSVDTLFRFLQTQVFNPASAGRVGFSAADGDAQRRDVEQFLLAFDNDLAPIVGQQVTLRADNAAAVGPRIDLLEARASAPFVSKILGTNARECDLVARVVVKGVPRSYRMQQNQIFLDPSGATLSGAHLRALAATPGQEVTYTCLPPGW